MEVFSIQFLSDPVIDDFSVKIQRQLPVTEP
jgi:hypothetical protein